MNLNQVTVAVTDIKISTEFYKKLGLKQIVRSEHYARFECPNGDSTVSIHWRAQVLEQTGVVVYFETEQLDHEVERIQRAGLQFDSLPQDQPWLWREARLRDPDGNEICLFWAGENRKNPHWRIES